MFEPAISDQPTDVSASGEPLYSVDYGVGTSDGFNPSPTPTVFPDITTADLPGQMAGLPGGGQGNGSIITDGSHNSLYIANPNPSPGSIPQGGNYLPLLSSVVTAAGNSFSAYVKGSPSVAIPPPRRPSGGVLSSVLSGSTNWMVIGIAVVAGIALMAVLAAKA
jgi:hypothetical protein